MLNIDRYHAKMSDASFKDESRLHERSLSETEAVFYVTQRKLPFAPCLGHERLIRSLLDSRMDRPRIRFLEQDRGILCVPETLADELGQALSGIAVK